MADIVNLDPIELLEPLAHHIESFRQFPDLRRRRYFERLAEFAASHLLRFFI
jgi:hypothetical protein